jgi:hypothetical protein
MISTTNPPIDLELVDKVYDHIPPHTWSIVKEQLIDALVNIMPAHIIEKITGDSLNDDGAIEILDQYYSSEETNKELISDAFRILGEENTAYLLDALHLDLVKDPSTEETSNGGS